MDQSTSQLASQSITQTVSQPKETQGSNQYVDL